MSIQYHRLRYFNPYTLELLESDMPELLKEINADIYGSNTDFIFQYYPIGRLKESISEKEKHMPKLIFMEVAYRQF